MLRPLLSILFLFLTSFTAVAQHRFTLVELNCENLFDCRHDTLKQDTEWLPASVRHWTPTRFWSKVNRLGQEILSSIDNGIPDLVALVEVENDSCLHALTRRSLLRHAGYEYLMTQSPDLRGIDVALLYQPATFRPICYECLRVPPLKDVRPTRDILYVQGEIQSCDTLHVFVVHAPSRYGGESSSRPNRLLVAKCITDFIEQLPPHSNIIVVGDFNDYADSHALKHHSTHGLQNVTAQAQGRYGKAYGTYRYRGEWQSIDHVLTSQLLSDRVAQTYINDVSFLLEDDKKYGGVKPLRTYNGLKYQNGFSDHLPLVVTFNF